MGCEKEISVSKLDRCETCGGSGAEKGSGVKTCSDLRRSRASA